MPILMRVTQLAHNAMAVSLGYSVYDLITMFWQQDITSPAMWLHHVILVVGTSLMPVSEISHYYNMVECDIWRLTTLKLARRGAYLELMFFITELSVLFGNLFWYVTAMDRFAQAAANQKFVPTSSRLKTFVDVMRIITFLLFRIPITPITVYQMTKLGQFRSFFKEHWFVATACSFNIVALTILNSLWGAVLLKRLLTVYLFAKSRARVIQ
jgi:hypothetical protein